ncbi:tRNA threonylcarbamoyladenosine dehydratase [[Clostridium] polysaccharolyticum]|uniref:tRNA A37 threonylcarbamoyladenosine dehydratase n=1 Tax=[Clostridium] polysaccharolyticum TaxID=29364 RepID=A0A1I0EI95_9FIRM|nr:tRNA threonylcarbamoyladenosine dehydratase [[Clostridium] polysaccharolyticum]SET45096.1 tRNA A37 threonylcarbamoyladenosine dehydratase [[Clostridium] polysaccharolyticum]
METEFTRTELLLGKDVLNALASKRVAVFGVGGVGGFACEALARSGVGTLDLFDKDTVSISNLNRQIIATYDTIGTCKVDAMKNRIAGINKNATVNTYPVFFLPENANEYDFSQYDYVIDAVDTVTAKLEIVMQAKKAGTPVISAMGAGNKLDPTRFEVADIKNTSVCPLAKVMRKELKKRGINSLKVVYSKEQPLVPKYEAKPDTRKVAPGSVAFIPSVAGLIIASEVIKDLGGLNGTL